MAFLKDFSVSKTRINGKINVTGKSCSETNADVIFISRSVIIAPVITGSPIAPKVDVEQFARRQRKTE